MSEPYELPFPPVNEPIESDREARVVTDNYAAVHRGERVLLLRDQHPLPKRLAEDLAPQGRDLEILRALWRYRFLLTSQIARQWWPGKSLYAAQRRLLRMTVAGFVTRFRPGSRRESTRRPRHVTEYSVVEHDLQVNAWVMAYRTLVGDHMIDWLGPDQGRIDVPTT